MQAPGVCLASRREDPRWPRLGEKGRGPPRSRGGPGTGDHRGSGRGGHRGPPRSREGRAPGTTALPEEGRSSGRDHLAARRREQPHSSGLSSGLWRGAHLNQGPRDTQDPPSARPVTLGRRLLTRLPPRPRQGSDLRLSSPDFPGRRFPSAAEGSSPPAVYLRSRRHLRRGAAFPPSSGPGVGGASRAEPALAAFWPTAARSAAVGPRPRTISAVIGQVHVSHARSTPPTFICKARVRRLGFRSAPPPAAPGPPPLSEERQRGRHCAGAAFRLVTATPAVPVPPSDAQSPGDLRSQTPETRARRGVAAARKHTPALCLPGSARWRPRHRERGRTLGALRSLGKRRPAGSRELGTR